MGLGLRRSALIAVAVTSATIGALSCGRTGVDPFSPTGGGTTPTGSPSGTGTATPPTPTPTFATGDGRDGPLVVATPFANFLNCHHLNSNTPTTFTVDNAGGFAASDRYLLWQTQDDLTGIATLSNTADMASFGNAGVWELVDGTTLAGNTITVKAKSRIAGVYTTDGNAHRAQACNVPQYSSLTVAAGGSITPTSWGNNNDGVVVIFVEGTARIDGAIDASGTGFHGGGRSGDNSNKNVSADDTDNKDGGGKGEGVDRSQSDANLNANHFGRGNYATAAGGGDAQNAGGGGGGAAGKGGWGGGQDASDNSNFNTDLASRGKPGVALIDSSGRLFLGGGGGGGHQNDNVGSNGANGGGVVVLFTNWLEGAGNILADGGDAGDSGNDGAGGGGAGGTILIYANHSTFSGRISASGGNGGNSNNITQHGPGGGGGGGWVLSSGALLSPPALLATTAGVGGKSQFGVTPWGETDGARGVIRHRAGP